MFSTGERRRKVDHSGGNAGQGATLLPLSYTSASNNYPASHNSRRLPRYHQKYDEIPSPTCHNFLLGGTYIPGKDKRKKHLRRRNKDFFTRFSPVKLGILTVVVLYLLRYCMLSNWFSRMRHRRQPTDWWWAPSSSLLNLTDRSRAQADAARLQKEQDRLSEANKAARVAALEKLSPRWFHRDQAMKKDNRHVRHQDSPGSMGDTIEDHKHAPSIPERKGVEQKEEEKFETLGADPVVKAAKKEIVMKTNQRGPKDASAAESPKEKPVQKEDLPGLLSIPPKRTETVHERQERTLHSMHNFSNSTACPSQLSDLEIVTTLVVQTTLSRSWVLDETCKRWTDPIIAVIVLTEAESHLEVSALLAGWEIKCPHISVVTHKMDVEEENPAMYPVNKLRNIGLDHVQTSHVLMVDVDFVPSDGLADAIRDAIMLRAKIREKDPTAIEAAGREAIVVPAFQKNSDMPCENEEDCSQHLRHNSSFVPHDFAQLRDCIKERGCNVFQADDNWEGHYSTRSERWLATDWYEEETIPGTELRDLKRISCFDSMRYEPYVVIRWCPANQDVPIVSPPFYDERFHGYGKNKIEYVQHLRFMGYQFSILPNGFIVHNPHAPSKAKKVWNDKDSNPLHKSMDSLYPEFLTELYKMFKENMHEVVGPCNNQ